MRSTSTGSRLGYGSPWSNISAATLIAAAVLATVILCNVSRAMSGAVVATPRALEEAMTNGTEHIVITAHLDLTGLPIYATEPEDARGALAEDLDVAAALFVDPAVKTIQVRRPPCGTFICTSFSAENVASDTCSFCSERKSPKRHIGVFQMLQTCSIKCDAERVHFASDISLMFAVQGKCSTPPPRAMALGKFVAQSVRSDGGLEIPERHDPQ